MRIGIIGAGPAGMTAAYQLAKAGVTVEVFEAHDAVGGMARSISLWGQTVDLGPHRFFSQDLRVNRLWLELAGRDYRMVDRLTRIFYKNRLFHYPLKPANALWNMGGLAAATCLASYAKARASSFVSGRDEATFESWVVNRFGRRLFEMFFQSYSEKLWGIPCDELDADFAAQRIKRLDLLEVIKHAVGIGAGRHKTLVDRFAYPVGGTGMIYERMAERVREHGGTIHLQTPVHRVLHDGQRVTGLELEGGRTRAFDHVISTMPLPVMVAGLGDVPRDVKTALSALTFRNTMLVYLQVQDTNLFPDQWLYIHSPELRMGRIANFRNWVPMLHGDAPTTILSLEYWCDDRDARWWESDAQWIALATRELRSTGLIRDVPVSAGQVVRVPRCYPVYATGYRAQLDRVATYLKTFRGITPIGRYGSFKYNNQDHSILMGILASENLLDGTAHDLWSVNTDYDTYQESAVITDTGLVRPGPTG